GSKVGGENSEKAPLKVVTTTSQRSAPAAGLANATAGIASGEGH
ncbi:MAG: MotA/TolQ/ExbB proton channel family protein, partial [Nitrosomonas sp. PRO5]|nr:MotA/TolQ/ExbB proton channel family protein [Nitrosomonas sp. PRO5]